MLLEMWFDLVKLRRAGGHDSHGAGNVARQEANCVFLLPKQGMRAPGATSQSLSELGQAQTHFPVFAERPDFMLRFHREDCSSLPSEILS